MDKDKKIVRYNLDDFHVVWVGRSAMVCPIDHPDCSNLNCVHTSIVLSKDGDDFTTLNTRYVGVHK